MSSALSIDFSNPAVIADPYPSLHALQDNEPAHWNPGLRSWCLTRYDDVAAALRDPRFSSDRIRPFVDGQHRVAAESIAAMGRTLSLWAVFTDPPLHTRLRALLNKGFTPGAIDALRGDVAAIVNQLTDALDAHEADLVTDFAWPLPATVIADILGVPRADLPMLKRWSDDIAEFVLVSRVNPEKYAVAAASLDEMCRYFSELIASLRRRPGRRVIDALIAARDTENDDALSAEELVASCALLLFAGHETTTHFIANSVWALLHERDGDVWDWLRARRSDPSQLATALNELLRWDGPSIAQARVLAADVELHDARMRAGQRVYVFLNAANRDPRHFADPDRLDLSRADARRHLAFGHGLHTCLGAHLARLEGAVALPILLERLAKPELKRHTPDWTDSLVIRGMKSLPIRYTLQCTPHRVSA